MSVETIFLNAPDFPRQADVRIVLRFGARFAAHASEWDRELDGALSRSCALPACTCASGEIVDILLPPPPPNQVRERRAVVLNLGNPAEMTALSLMQAGAKLARFLESVKESRVTLLHDWKETCAVARHELSGRLLLGLQLGNYRFALMGKQDKAHAIEIFVSGEEWDVDSASRFTSLAEGVCLARDLVNYPASHLHPDNFADYLAPLAAAGVAIEELQEEQLKQLGMGALLAVGGGSARKPRLLLLRYCGKNAPEQPLALVGKGICFDAGGLCIKTTRQMFPMRGDMAGAAAVAGTLLALARQQANVHVVGILAIAENLPSATSYKPGDIIESASGRTIEVYDTDCEGRMVLCDALHYAATRCNPSAIIDLATLTYSVMQGLGPVFAGLFASDDKLAQTLLAAGERTGERFWRLPLDSAYDEGLRSPVADLRQHAKTDDGDAPYAAAFLKHFAESVPWAHLDIAGKELLEEDAPLARAGASGFGVLLLEEWLNGQ
ncbi:leucyl aminopeptidase family protein [Ventosimonas gracilis]|nr:leucyl aminopeptidase family protein [Ventosimonas gracilis]